MKRIRRNSRPKRPVEGIFQPKISGHLRPVLRQIGVPKPRPFQPDPFQVESLDKLRDGDVVVSAPTGSGKTWIAVEAMSRVLESGGRTWYASPLKALSNAKFIEFGRRFGEDRVGLLTGDHKVNADAPLIVGTTEILRNQLYDAMSRGTDLATDLVVMDEAHYIGDPERGVVWEEVIIYLPERVRLLLLSATVANADEIAEWLSRIRGQQARTVITNERPVPLHPLFLFPDGLLSSLDKGKSLAPQVGHFAGRHPVRGRRGKMPPISFRRVLRALDEADLLPAIFFLKSRSDCDTALAMCRNVDLAEDPETSARLEKRLDELLEKYPFLRTHAHMKYISGPRMAAHHAGHMPHWKLMVEQLMQEGLLKAIFSTTTVAAGVNFPARTVVITQSDQFNGREFADLTTTQLMQMTGRAGRRGMDRIGFALVVPGPFMDVQLVHSLFHAPSEPVQSRIQINFSMCLNLIGSHYPDQIKGLLDASLAAFQQGSSRLAKEREDVLSRLDEALQDRACAGPEDAVYFYRMGLELDGEVEYLRRIRPRKAWETALHSVLEPGRIFSVYGGQVFCVLEHKDRHGREGVQAAKLKSDLGLRKGRVRSKWVALGQIDAISGTRLRLDPEYIGVESLRIIQRAASEEHDFFAPGELDIDVKSPELDHLDTRVSEIMAQLDRRPCTSCSIYHACQEDPYGDPAQLFNRLARLEAESPQAGHLLWASFLKHLEFLQAEGFVSEQGELTDDGRWAAQLRLDHPLLIAEGIRESAWPEDSASLLAAVVAPFVVDKEFFNEEAAPKLPPRLASAWMKLESVLDPMRKRLQDRGFGVPRPRPRAALAILAWAEDAEWEDVVALYGQDPGDMAMLVFRTADNLRQMAGLTESHPQLAPKAREAVELIVREPVVIPL